MNTRIIGWPDQTTLRFDPREAEPEDQMQIDAQLAEWAEDCRNSDPDEDRSTYETTRLDLPGGTCIRIREHLKGADQTDGPEPALPEEAYFQQICVTPSGGAFS